MTVVNLIPPDVLESRRRQRHIHRWAVAVVLAAAAAAVPALLDWRQQTRLADLLERKDRAEQQAATLRTELTALAQSLTDLSERIEQGQTLRTKRPWAGLLALIAGAMPEEVWLTSVDTGKPAPEANSKSKSTAEEAPAEAQIVIMDGARKVDLVGYAVNHEDLYDFIARLKQTEVFAHVDLLKAGRVPVLRAHAVRFELTCDW